MQKPTAKLSGKEISQIEAPLKKANRRFNQNFPGESAERQPTHTVYGGAQIFKSNVGTKMGEAASKHFNEHAPTARALIDALEIKDADEKIWQQVHSRTVNKLKSEPVEDFRIDFEDGYGNRPDNEEDGHAESAAKEVVEGMRQKTLPPFIGIRIKPFNEERFARGLRTLDIFMSTLVSESKGKLPENFVVTLPKVQIEEQAKAFETALTILEKKLKLKNKTIQCELMIETPQSIIDVNGKAPMRSFIDAMKGRCRGAHFGTYDYTAGCNITAQYQTMANPVCDFAKHVMQVTLAGTPIMLSDGATNVMPVGKDKEAVYKAWRLSYRHIRHSLATGYYQGWDLHPAQLPIRYAAVYSFFLESYDQAAGRLKSFIEKAARATLLGDVFDDAATGQGLLNYFLRGMSCGAITESEALLTGLDPEDFQSRSFLKILERRKLV
jgi:citrate lyase beta subunit